MGFVNQNSRFWKLVIENITKPGNL